MKQEYLQRKRELEYLIAFNNSIHCPRVAAKWQRELDKLNKQYEQEGKSL